MYMTHTFANRETLSRAHSWLTRHGFHARHTEFGVPRITVVEELNRLAAAQMLINAVENADPNGFPGFWDQPSDPHAAAETYHQDRLAQPAKPRTSVIGWHPLD
jgi:hypothetical protein